MKLAFHASRIAIAAATVLILSACGGGGDASPTAAPTANSQPPAVVSAVPPGGVASPPPPTTVTSPPPAATGPVAQPAPPPAAPGAVAQPAPPPALVKAAPESVGFSSQDLLNVKSAVVQRIDTQKFTPSATVFVARHGKIVLDEIINGTDLRGGNPLAADTIYRLHSMTKPVTAVAMLQLYEKGLWKLDDPITKFIPEFKDLKVLKSNDWIFGRVTEPVARPATMLELMTHTAGFAYGLSALPANIFNLSADDLYFSSGLFKSTSTRDFIDKLASLPLANQPGTKWQYSVAVDVQGVIIERLTGKTLPQYMAENIFTPLKMVDTGFNVPQSKRTRLATLYTYIEGSNYSPTPTVWNKGFPPFDALEAMVFADPTPLPSGGGGLLSTTSDYARFAQMLLSGGTLEGVQVLKPETVRMMMTNQLTPELIKTLSPTYPGLGFGMNGSVVMNPSQMNPALKQAVGTYSWGGASGTTFWVDPANDLIAVGMEQLMGDLTYPSVISPKIYDALIDSSK